MRIAITGTPGTGKTALARALGKTLKRPVLDVKKLVAEKRLGYHQKSEAETTVPLKPLARAVQRWFREHPDGIAESHLLCEFDAGADLVVVLRCQPDVLEKRLRKRRYPKSKIKGNVESEALDYCLVQAESHYRSGRVMPVDATRRLSPKRLAGKIRDRQGDAVNWSPWLRKNAARLSKP